MPGWRTSSKLPLSSKSCCAITASTTRWRRSSSRSWRSRYLPGSPTVERAAQIDALHTQLYTLLDEGWGTWKYDASEQRVSFDSGPVGKYNALLRQIQQVAGVEPEASDEPSAPADAPEARGAVDTHNPGFKADRDAYERRMREEQEKKWGKASGLESLQHLRSPR